MVTSRLADEIGRVLSDRYRLIAPIGAGASARVFLAEDTRLRRRVAVKLLHDGLADDEAFRKRFEAEARTVAALSHPHVVTVHDWGRDGEPYLVTEYLAGGSLRSMLDRGLTLSPSQALLVGLEATRALDYAHRRGLVHRDIKPDNLLFGDDLRLRIADFGLARALSEAAWTEPTGVLIGSARYASPEQARGEPVDGKADVYSLGLVLVEAVTGTVPFSSDTTVGSLMARTSQPMEVGEEMGPLQGPVERVGDLDPATRPDAGGLTVALMAAAEQMPRPASLPLVGAMTPGDDIDAGVDRTNLPGRTEAGIAIAQGATETAVATVPEAATRLSGADEIPPDAPAVEGEQRRRRRWPIVVALAVVLLALAGGGAFALGGLQTPSHTVPELIGLQEEEATELIEAQGWEVERLEARLDGSQPGEILDQDPLPETSLSEGETVTITVSLGNEPVPVPTDLAGLTVDEAEARLVEAGLLLGEVTGRYDEDAAEGTVIGAGVIEAPRGDAVDLIVSDGPEPRIVPDGLTGGSFDQAASALTAIQLVATQVDEFSDTVAAGVVIRTEPGAGGEAERDSVVNVVVSAGPPIVTMPDLAGVSVSDATAQLAAIGLAVDSVVGSPSNPVIATDPSAGEQVRIPSTVRLFTRR